jgi:hypothetical protein
MKKKIYSIVLAGTLLLSPAMFFSCDMEDDEEYCHNKGKLYCESTNACCSSDVPWTDGHGSCYNTLSYCRETGWACSACY